LHRPKGENLGIAVAVIMMLSGFSFAMDEYRSMAFSLILPGNSACKYRSSLRSAGFLILIGIFCA
jgi:hypothetical protein